MKRLSLFILVCLCLTSGIEAQYKHIKPVYVHYKDSDIINANSELFEYWHLTNHYFYRKPGPEGQTYDYRSIDPAVFKKNYLDTDRRWWKDTNHPWLYRDIVLDLEMNPLGRVDDNEWWRWTQEYIQIARMTKAAGKAVGIYGVTAGASEFQIWWNVGRYKWYLNPKLNPKYYDATDRQKNYWKLKLKQFQAKEGTLVSKIEKISTRFDKEIDSVVLELYAPYVIPSENFETWQWYAWRYYIDEKIAMYSMSFPDKPVYVFLQPNFTQGWKPMPLTVWNLTFQYVMGHEDVDRVYIFNLKSKPKTEGWENILINGQESD